MDITGKKLFVIAMREEGVDTIFGYPGGMVTDLFDELYKADDIYNKVIYVKSHDYEKLTQVKEYVENFTKNMTEFKYVSIQFDFNPL